MSERLVIKEENGKYNIYHRRYEKGEPIDTLIADNEKDVNKAIKIAKNIAETVEAIFHKSIFIEVEIYE